MNNKFESFDEFCLKLNEDERGVFGTLIDKSASYLPRLLRFKQAKSTMKSYLRGFEKKSVNLISHFEKNIKKMTETAVNNYTNFKHDKLDVLMAHDKIDQAVSVATNYKKDLLNLKETEIKKINTAVDKIMDAYTAAIDKRIDSPGFIINVELSEKGKGNLKAKWAELSAIKKMEVDEKLSGLIANAGLARIDEINAELEAFIEEHKYSYGKNALDFYVSSITQLSTTQFKIEIFLRAPGHRHALSEKGLLVSDDPDKLSDPQSAKLVKMPNLFFSSYTMTINAREEDFIRPYLKLTNSIKPKFGEIESIGDFIANQANLTGSTSSNSGNSAAPSYTFNTLNNPHSTNP